MYFDIQGAFLYPESSNLGHSILIMSWHFFFFQSVIKGERKKGREREGERGWLTDSSKDRPHTR